MSESNPTEQVGLNAQQWQDKLSLIAIKLKSKAILTLMGSAPNMLKGQPSRMSMDLDVWKPTSTYDTAELRQAVEESGLLFNPKQDIPDKPYIQIVEPGICQLGSFKNQDLERLGALELTCPPVENLIASKLLRADPKDLEDISWLCSNYNPDLKKIKEIIKTFPTNQREVAKENLVYLEVIISNNKEKNKDSQRGKKGTKVKEQESTIPNP
jgi:hypothetical protein